MIKFDTSIEDDIPQLVLWIANDPYHYRQVQPTWWLTGNGLLAFTLLDERGSLCYVRLDDEDGYIRIHTQFAPETVVPKRRLLVGMVQCMDELIKLYGKKKGMIFNSVNPSLIAFMNKRFGFTSVGNDDYRLDFEEQT